MRRVLPPISAYPLLAALLLLGACDLVPFGACTDEARPGIRVEVLDSITEREVDADTVYLVATSGSYSDSTFMLPARQFGYVTHERPGTFLVTARATGYRTWAALVRVREDQCHVRTTNVLARMQR